MVVTEDGARQANLATAADGVVIDVSPAFSPDGRWVAFASTRERTLEEFSLWVVAAHAGSTPVRVTEGVSVDLTPAWTRDGRALVFASNRDGDFDLWQLPLAFEGDAVRAGGEAERVVDLDGQELSPAIAADGRIAFTRREGTSDVRTWIAVRSPDGEVEDVTRGPADTGPTWTPDGGAIVFTAPNVRSDPPSVDGDLWQVDVGGGEPTLLLDVPGASEGGAQFSADGRWLFVTSIVIADTGELVFASVVFADWRTETPTVRMLVDPAGAVPRRSVALGPGALDGATLALAPEYGPELADILERARAAREAAGPTN